MGGGSWGDTGQTREIDYGGEIDFDISGITLESGGTSEGQVHYENSVRGYTFHGHVFLMSLTHISLASFLWDIGKQYSPRCDASQCGVTSGAILFA